MLIWIATTFFVYILFWALAAFLVLPFGIRTHHDETHPDGVHDLVPGQEKGAPTNFRPRRFLLRTTLLATAAYAVFYANYQEGWITLEDISVIHPPASVAQGY